MNHLIIPAEEAVQLVIQAGKVYLRDCPCRLEMQVCPRDKWQVCLLFEHASETDREKAKPITVDEAVRIIRMTTERGDIHQVFYFQDGACPFELCNCCTCCCFPLREMKERNNYAGEPRCDFISITDEALCIGCGLCLDSCFFEARNLDNDMVNLIDERCLGCGRCIDSCPDGAIRIEHQDGRGNRSPAYKPSEKGTPTCLVKTNRPYDWL